MHAVGRELGFRLLALCCSFLLSVQLNISSPSKPVIEKKVCVLGKGDLDGVCVVWGGGVGSTKKHLPLVTPGFPQVTTGIHSGLKEAQRPP